MNKLKGVNRHVTLTPDKLPDIRVSCLVSPTCDKTTTTLLATSSCSVTYPVVLIEIEGVKCRTLIYIGTRASYASSTLVNNYNKKPILTETKKIDSLMSTSTRKIKIYSVKIQDISC